MVFYFTQKLNFLKRGSRVYMTNLHSYYLPPGPLSSSQLVPLAVLQAGLAHSCLRTFALAVPSIWDTLFQYLPFRFSAQVSHQWGFCGHPVVNCGSLLHISNPGSIFLYCTHQCTLYWWFARYAPRSALSPALWELDENANSCAFRPWTSWIRNSEGKTQKFIF